MGRARAFTAKVEMRRGKPTGQVGTFSHETTSQSKLLREAGGKFQEWRAPLPRASPRLKSPVKSIQRSIRRTRPNSSWLRWRDAFLRMKVERGPAALDRFKNILFQTVFKESTNESPL